MTNRIVCLVEEDSIVDSFHLYTLPKMDSTISNSIVITNEHIYCFVKGVLTLSMLRISIHININIYFLCELA